MNMTTATVQSGVSPSTKGTVLILNDKSIYNKRYRSPLLAGLASHGFTVDCQGVLDSSLGIFALLVRLRSQSWTLTISSNLKSNLFALVFARGPLVIILNGLGRFRRSRRLRGVLRHLMRRRPGNQFIVQSYSDYRYLRRYTDMENLHWLPGSGGRRKPIGTDNSIVLVQRDSKIGHVAHSVRDFMETAGSGRTLGVVGCENSERSNALFSGLDFRAVGYLPADDILAGGNTFLQPEGYGEGFPHTLADAIASGASVIISDREYLRYGLQKLGAAREQVATGWSRLDYGDALQQQTGAETIARKTLRICDQAIGNFLR